MTEHVGELVKIISGLIDESTQRKDFEKLLEISVASWLLFRALPGGEEVSRSAVYSMRDAVSLWTGEDKKTRLACSFCDRQEPEVMIGAGPDDVFICDDCVSIFTEAFRLKKEKGKSANGVD